MTENQLFSVGTILKNRLNQFAKIISFSKGIYGLSGWTSLEHAQKAETAKVRFNKIALSKVGFEIVSGSQDVDVETEDEQEGGDETTVYEQAKLDKMSAKDVKALATQIGVDAEGTKKEVIARILAR